MKIAVEGCAHGELDKIYESLEALEVKNNIKVDLLIICGDFQAVRNPTDLDAMAVPPKFRKLNTFYKYYSGEKKAPVLTIFIGGNHEASNYLSELSYGGWVCPNIFYMGYANVINVCGLRIAGLSGIYKGHDYLKGHFETPPYDKSSVKSVYHVRTFDVFRLKQIKKPVDICISHDWPKSVYRHGNMQQLLRFKPFFREEMESDKLGSQPAKEILDKLKPSYWFAAHLHCKFSAIVPHDDEERPCTKFLALDKCLPKRRFLQILEVGNKSDSIHISYDPEWLCVLRNTNHLLNVSRKNSYMPGVGGNEQWDFSATDEDIQNMKEQLGVDLRVPNNFTTTAPICISRETFPKNDVMKKYLNPQTQRFCKLFNLTDPYQAVSSSGGFSISDFSGTDTDLSFSSVPSLNLDEMSCSDEEEEKETSPRNEELDVSEGDIFFIDTKGSNQNTSAPTMESLGFVIDTVGSPRNISTKKMSHSQNNFPPGCLIDNKISPVSVNSQELSQSGKSTTESSFVIDKLGSPHSSNTPNDINSTKSSTFVGKMSFSNDTNVQTLTLQINEKIDSPQPTNTQKFLESQFCDIEPITETKPLESFPEIKEDKSLLESNPSEENNTSTGIMLKRRNFSLYTNTDDDFSEKKDETVDIASKFKRRNAPLYQS